MSSERPMAAVALSVLTRHGKPIYLKTFEGDNALKYHFILHAGLDHLQEKERTQKTRCVIQHYHFLLAVVVCDQTVVVSLLCRSIVYQLLIWYNVVDFEFFAAT